MQEIKAELSSMSEINVVVEPVLVMGGRKSGEESKPTEQSLVDLEEVKLLLNSALERLNALEERGVASYDDSNVIFRLNELESKPDNDTIYNDAALIERIEALEAQENSKGDETLQDTGWIDISHLVTNTTATASWKYVGLWSVRRVGNRVLLEGRSIVANTSSVVVDLGVSGFNGLFSESRGRPGDSSINCTCINNRLFVNNILSNNSSTNYFRASWDTIEDFPDVSSLQQGA